MILLDGKKVSLEIQQDLQYKIDFLLQKGIKPGLGVILAGESKESITYVNMKRKKCYEMGIATTVYHYQETISQEAIVDTIISGLREVITHTDCKSLIAGGGVLANSRLRKHLRTLSEEHQIKLHIPELIYCVDNAAMVAGLGWYQFSNNQFADLELTASPRGIAS